MRQRYKGIGVHKCQWEFKDCCWPQLKPRATCCEKLIGAIRNSMLPSYYHPMARHVYKSMRSLEKEKLRMVYKCSPYVAHPLSVFAIICCCTCFFFMYFYITWSTFELYFLLYGKIGWLTITCKAIQSVYIALQFLIGYRIKGTNSIQLELGSIAIRYLRTQLIFDVLELLRPLLIFVRSDCIALWLHMIIFHLYLISRLFGNINWWLLKVLGIRIRYEQIVWFSIVTLYSMHYLICMHYGMDQMLPVLKGDEEELEDPHPEPLVKAKKYYDHFFVVALFYMLALNLVMSNNSAIGRPIIDTIMFITLFFLHLFMVVTVFITVMDMQHADMKCTYMWKNILNYMNNRNLRGRLRTKIKAHYTYKFQNKFFDETALLSSLSTHLQYEKLLHTCSHLMINIDLLHGLPKTVVSGIVATLHPLVYLPNDVIMRYSTTFECMYFISFGTVAMYNSFGKELQHMDDGELIGSIGYYSGVNYMTVSAVTITELFRWNKHDIRPIMKTSPELSMRVKTLGKQQLELIIRSQGTPR